MLRASVCAMAAWCVASELNAGWSCDGPLPSVHGPKSGDLVDGKFEVLLHSTPLAPREAHAEVLGSIVELELVAPEDMDGFEGFMVVPSKGFVKAGDLNSQDTDCGRVGGVTHIPTVGRKKKYTINFGLPSKYGDVDLKVIALAKEKQWYESTMHFYVGEEEAGAADHRKSSARQMVLIIFLVCASLGTTCFVGISSWPKPAERKRRPSTSRRQRLKPWCFRS